MASFWKQTAERAIKTVAQTLIALLAAGPLDVLSVDWETALSVSLGAGLLSVLSSIVSRPIGTQPNSPSAV